MKQKPNYSQYVEQEQDIFLDMSRKLNLLKK